MRAITALLMLLLVAAPTWAADELPKGPKAPPPEPLPEPICDTAKPSGPDWFLGRWVSPYARWEFSKGGETLTFRLEQKAGISDQLGYKEGAVIEGKVSAHSPCTLRLEAGEGQPPAFVFEGVATGDGKIYGFARNPAGLQARWILRRER